MRKVDAEVMAGFLEEARGYLPQIRGGLMQYREQPTATDVLTEVHRHTHCIKGASSMLGLSALGHIAWQLEEAVEDILESRLTLSDEVSPVLDLTVDLIETYLNGIEFGNLDEQSLLVEVTSLYRRMRGLSPEGDEAALAHLLTHLHPVQPAARPQSPPPAVQEAATAEPAPITDEVQIEFDPPLDEPQLPDFSMPVPTNNLPEVEPDFTAREVRPEKVEEVSAELLEVFALEADEHLRNINTHLPALEQKPDDKDLLQTVRRSVHTLKGTAGMVGFRKITQLAHRMEDLLDLLYDEAIRSTPEIRSLLYESADALQDLAAGKGEDAVLERLYATYSGLLTAPAEGATEETAVVQVSSERREADVAADEAVAKAAQRMGQYVRVPIERLDELVKLVSELVITRTAFEQRMSDSLRQQDELQLSVDRLRRASTKLETEYEARALASSHIGVGAGAGMPRQDRFSWQDRDFDDLEFDRYTEFHLLSRELGETTSDIHTVSGELGTLHGDYDSLLNRQSRLCSEIQDKLMRVRMLPLATLATQLHRTVRTVATQQGKQVSLVLQGEDIELDKTVLEEMSEPLLHLLRNAVDHGIEAPALRQARGKGPRGTVRLEAYYEGTQVVLRLEDDGAGVDPEVLRTSAIEKGFASASDAAEMAEADLFNLLFLPGFSTAHEVSEISGRGVGLDIVRTKVQKLKGTVSLQSRPGQGSVFFIRLPLTLAITRALLVRSNAQTFALPLASIQQILRLDDVPERVGQEPVLRVAGRVYPVHYLGSLLQLPHPADDTVKRPPVLLVNAGDHQIALVVDKLLGGREIVVKTLGTHVRQLRGVTGATLMGDGTVVLILNPTELFQASQSTPNLGTPRPLLSRTAAPQAPGRDRNELTVMVVDDSPSVRRVVSNLISKAGWTPLSAKDGLDALELLHRSASTPDILLLDIEMPRMDGYELLGILRSQPAYQAVPVVMITSRAGEKHRRKAMELGASAYVVKPYQDEALLGIIHDLVQKARRSSQE